MNRLPPAVLQRLLAWVLPPGRVRDGLLGDLAELYAERAQKGRALANLWYAEQLLSATLHYPARRLHRRAAHQTEKRTMERLATHIVDAITRDSRHALRRLVRDPRFSLTTVATLAIGIGVTASVFALVNAVLIRPLPYPDPGRLVAVGHAAPRIDPAKTGLSGGTYLHYERHNRTFEGIATYVEEFYTLSDLSTPELAPELVRIAYVSPSFFSILRVTPVVGRLPSAADFEFGDPEAVLINHDLWVRRYGADPRIVGQTVELDGRAALVTGVAQAGLNFPHPAVGVWIVWAHDRLESRIGAAARIHSLTLNGVGRLKPGVSIEAAEQDIDALVASLPDAYGDVTAEELEAMGLRAAITPLKDAIIGDTRPALLMLQGAAIFLLLIMWANVTNLSLLRAERRRREVGVARALGGNAGQIARGFILENGFLAALGGALALALVYLAVGIRFGFDANAIPRAHDLGVDVRVFAVVIALSVLSTAALSAVSITSALRPTLAGVLTGELGRITASGRAQLGRRLLVGTQVALTLILLVGSALMAQSFWRLKRVPLGFEPENVLAFHMPIPRGLASDYRSSARVHYEVLERLRGLPGVAGAEAASLPNFPLTPPQVHDLSQFAVAERADEEREASPYAASGFATPGYFRIMGIPLVRGRTFEDVDTSPDAPGVILSESLARALFGTGDPIGRQVRFTGRMTFPDFPDYTVIGVVGDVPGHSLREGPSMAFYFPHIYPPRADRITGAVHFSYPFQEVVVVRTSLSPGSLVPAIDDIVRDVDPRLVVTRVARLERVVADAAEDTRVTMLLLFVGSVTALFLAIVGVYGVLAYAVAQRGPELGLRIALGASPAAVVRMVVGQGARLSLIGIAAGLPAAFVLVRFLESLLFEVRPGNPLAFGATAALLFGVGLAASYLPARRAGRTDPATALKGR